MGRQIERVPRAETTRAVLAIYEEVRRSGEHDHPLAPVLVVPEPRRACIAPGDDAFDPQPGPGEQRLDGFRHHTGINPGAPVFASSGCRFWRLDF